MTRMLVEALQEANLGCWEVMDIVEGEGKGIETQNFFSETLGFDFKLRHGCQIKDDVLVYVYRIGAVEPLYIYVLQPGGVFLFPFQTGLIRFNHLNLGEQDPLVS